MRRFVKPALFAILAVGCLALGSGAQQPTPPAPPTVPPIPGSATGRTITKGGGTYEELVAPGGQRYYSVLWNHDATDAMAGVIAKQLVEAKTDAEKEQLKGKLKETLNKQFDDRQKRHEKEIEALEAQVKKLKEMVSKRQENKKEIIEDRTKQLEREAKGLGW